MTRLSHGYNVLFYSPGGSGSPTLAFPAPLLQPSDLHSSQKENKIIFCSFVCLVFPHVFGVTSLSPIEGKMFYVQMSFLTFLAAILVCEKKIKNKNNHFLLF